MNPIPLFRRKRHVAIAGACISALTMLFVVAPPSSSEQTWVDPSPHKAGYVTVARNVRLHYLDWGGTGEPLVFLTGHGNSAHSFDELAPRFTDRFHVLALTRRGQVESSKPAGPYDIATLTEDIRKVLDSLKLGRVNLAGHSFAGQELTQFAITHPDRVNRLVYLDAAYDYFFTDSMNLRIPSVVLALPDPPAPSARDCVTPDAFIAFSKKTFGIAIPEAEVRLTFVRLANGSCGRNGAVADPAKDAMLEGVVRQNYRAISRPALALFAIRDSLSQEEPWLQADPIARIRYPKVQAEVNKIVRASEARFAREAPLAKVVEIHGANHWLFVSHLPDVVREMRTFLLAP